MESKQKMPAMPDAGTTAPSGKSTDPGPFKYRFSTDTAVRTAKEVPGATMKCVDVQTASNKSKLPKDFSMTSNDKD